MKRLFGLVLTVGLFLAGCGASQSGQETGGSTNQTLQIGATGQSFPNSYLEGDKLVGYDVEVAEKIAENLGYEVEWTTASFDGLMGQLETKRLDTIANNFAGTPKRAEAYAFSDPYNYAYTGIGVLADSSYQSIADLEGQTIGGVFGSNKTEALNKYIEDHGANINVKTYENREGAELDVSQGRNAGFVQDAANIEANIAQKKAPFRVLLVKDIPHDNIVFPFADDEEGRALRDQFNQELEKLRADGTLKALSEKYYGIDVTEER
ncbi:hypothetical protein AWM75_07535 [Aerococcus urinaehominis]|uniref:Uncharacterized protein n=1 Tax=Aerococcus urinaehominis TaxID=128944 RepID=A0A0X8FM43_9LACT|nr:transporter substrate-binding domain-containing protein [Aerococcus urinaehominis]AMB99825.1 hypothetical protein AWM75_07535 [Aerococcus urinaehominis]SDM55396.1 putative amino-acid transport system substrate-binding protein [Aerococcus urinaehominis]